MVNNQTTGAIAFTTGEPAGIGPDLAVALAQHNWDLPLVCIADPDVIRQRARLLGQQFDVPQWNPDKPVNGLSIAEVASYTNVTPGQLDAGNSPFVLDTLDRAIEGCLLGEFSALVTGPIHKGVINDANIPFTGHTEYLAERSGTHTVVMMLACPKLRVALATTHVPLNEVSKHISQEQLERIIRILHTELQTRFAINEPVISVCGLNPHAGESGHIGTEEIDSIVPALDNLRQQGIKLLGPLPADTAFTPRALEGVDAVLAMYHDQGLPVLKHICFGQAVNITLGLPFIRTSVDHGTALDLAGSGQCDSGSLMSAIQYARELLRT
jgi:4-hydroxythreonine-4-phosphate dehydrogenase